LEPILKAETAEIYYFCNNNIYVMAFKRQKFFFALSAEEQDSRLKAVLAEEMEKVKAMNLPVVYRNELCVKPNLFIHKYPNGHTVLIEQDSYNSEEKIIKVLQ
jgi:hypothetical protein